MTNKVYTSNEELARDKVRHIEQGRFRVSRHAGEKHPELTDVERAAIVRYGTGDKPDRERPASAGVYLCWATLPTHGVCRAVFCIEETSSGTVLKIITAFPES